jgi:hypothetical protein
MKKFQPNKLRLNLKNLTTPLIALSLIAGCVGLFGGSVSAASVTMTIPLIPSSDFFDYYGPGPTGELTSTKTTVSSSGGGNYVEGGSYRIDPNYTPNLCQGAVITRIDLAVEVTNAAYDSEQHLEVIMAGADSNGIINPGYDVDIDGSSGQYASFYNTVYAFRGADDGNPDIGTLRFHTITPNPITPYLLQNTYLSIQHYYLQSAPQYSTMTTKFPMVTATYDDSACNSAPTIASPAPAIITPTTTTSGSTVVPGSSLSATDTDGDTLTYSITAGNANSYFAIDSTTGDITTTSTNIPAGTYTITVQVDDGNGGTATADITITVTASTPTYYCPAPYDTTELLTPTGDCDNDGIDNQTEGFDPNGDSSPADARDTDGDGIADYVDPDSDNDGLIDSVEGVVDLDSDGKPDYIDPATPPSTTYYCPLPYDTTELLTPTGDCDNDGIDNQTEGFDPNSDSSPADARDTDGDGIADYVDPDSDNDGITDKVEGTTDTDGDGKPNYVDADSDNDGITDATEGTTDTDGDGKPNYIDTDSDNDGKPDSTEGTKDTDGDGIPDYIDALDDKQQASQNKTSRPTLANTGQSLKAITIVATMALGLAGYTKLKNKSSKSYRRR